VVDGAALDVTVVGAGLSETTGLAVKEGTMSLTGDTSSMFFFFFSSETISSRRSFDFAFSRSSSSMLA